MLDFIKLLCGGLAMLTVGVVLILLPGEIGEELQRDIPYPFEFGVAGVAFGSVMTLTAFVHTFAKKSRTAHALRKLLLTAVGAVISYACILVLYGEVQAAWQLADDGVVTQAEIVRRTSVLKEQRLKTALAIRYDGHRGKLTPEKSVARSARDITVLYSPSQPELVREFRGTTEFWPLLDQSIGTTAAIIGAVVLLFFAGLTFFSFLAIFRPPTAAEIAELD